MTVYVGLYREIEIICEVLDLGVGAGEINCIECGGDGDWTKFHPEPWTGPYPCVPCKGTGRVLVSI